MLKTFFCIASGPSLTRKDCELVQSTGHPIIAVNNTWQMFPDSLYAVYAGDASWWESHFDEVPQTYFRRCTASRRIAREKDIEFHRYWPASMQCNSGAGAILYAASQGAEKIILLGYDCSLQHGSHWHGQHEQLRNPTETSIKRWHKDFLFVQNKLNELDIINCTRRTDLKCFPLKNLEREIVALSLGAARHLQDLKPPAGSQSSLSMAQLSGLIAPPTGSR